MPPNRDPIEAMRLLLDELRSENPPDGAYERACVAYFDYQAMTNAIWIVSRSTELFDRALELGRARTSK